MKGTGRSLIALVGVLAVALTACGPGEDTPPMGDGDGAMHGDMPTAQSMMEAHAQEADSMAAAMRQHLRQMRQRPAEEWYERMGEHVNRVSQMLGLMNRQMREMDMGMDMDDEAMGGMMGMSGEEHRRMMNEMRSLRTDLEQLQTASTAQVRQRMPDHLDRLEGMVVMMERSAEAMGRM